MNQPLKSKIAVISGASRGIGRAIALELAAKGASIAINFVRNEEAAQEVAKEVEALGSKALLHQGNIGEPKFMDELLSKTVETFGGIDILVHNAALGAFKPVHKLKVNHWDLSMDVNTKAFFLLAQKTLPHLEKRGGGHILTISSLGAQRFIPNYGAIGISKAALESLVKYLAVELAEKNIHVNCISGGLIDTDALKSFPDYENMKAEVIKRTPGGRIGKPEDISKIIAFLLSEDANWICGQTIIADGGFSLIA